MNTSISCVKQINQRHKFAWPQTTHISLCLDSPQQGRFSPCVQLCLLQRSWTYKGCLDVMQELHAGMVMRKCKGNRVNLANHFQWDQPMMFMVLRFRHLAVHSKMEASLQTYWWQFLPAPTKLNRFVELKRGEYILVHLILIISTKATKP